MAEQSKWRQFFIWQKYTKINWEILNVFWWVLVFEVVWWTERVEVGECKNNKIRYGHESFEFSPGTLWKEVDYERI